MDPLIPMNLLLNNHSAGGESAPTQLLPPQFHKVEDDHPSFVNTVEINDLSSQSSAASTVMPTLGASIVTVVDTVLASSPTCLALSDQSDEHEGEELISHEHVTRAVDLFFNCVPNAKPAAHTALFDLLSQLLEKGFTTMAHLICALVLLRRLQRHEASDFAILEEDSTLVSFPSLAEHAFAITASSSKRTLVGLLRLVAKGHGDVYYGIADMLTAANISVTGDMVGMTARCEWRLFDALGGNIAVSPSEYVSIVEALEC